MPHLSHGKSADSEIIVSCGNSCTEEGRIIRLAKPLPLCASISAPHHFHKLLEIDFSVPIRVDLL